MDEVACSLRLAGCLEKRSTGTFSVWVGRDQLAIPYRIYAGESLLRLFGLRKPDVFDCILTRHHDGFVRSRAAQRILDINQPWSMPYIVQLAGEYVVEILDQIDSSFDQIDPAVMGGFIRANPPYIQLTKQRVASYWDCYYRHIKRQNYVGFRLINKIEATAKSVADQVGS